MNKGDFAIWRDSLNQNCILVRATEADEKRIPVEYVFNGVVEKDVCYPEHLTPINKGDTVELTVPMPEQFRGIRLKFHHALFNTDECLEYMKQGNDMKVIDDSLLLVREYPFILFEHTYKKSNYSNKKFRLYAKFSNCSFLSAPPSNQPHACNCNIVSLINLGCKCGGI